VRRRNAARLAAYLAAAAAGADPAHGLEHLDSATRRVERLMLGLRLDEGVERAAVDDVLDPRAVGPLAAAGLLELADDRIRLTRRGRLLANDVTARLLRDADDARTA
jgi:oxygen-independent coproporphyrinogen-3 oxidase